MASDYLKLKKALRALLLSTKGGCSPRTLVDDYKLIYGEGIPYKQLGFNTLMDLLHDMRDAVAVHRRAEGTRLYGIPDESTKHIAGMVAKQKDSKKNRATPTSFHPTTSMITKRSASWGAKDDPAPKAPLTFHAQLKTLFLSYPNGVALHDFAEAFARRFGYYFSYKGWGFTSLEQVLLSVPEVITMETDPMRKCRIVKLTKPPTGKREGVREGVTVRKPSIESINSQKLDTSESLVPQSGSESLNSLELSPRKSTSRLKQILATKDPPKRRRVTVPKKVVDQVETILRAFPTGIWLSRFPNEFKKYFDEDLPVSTLGFSSVLHLLTSTPVCEVERPTGLGDWLVFRRGGPRPKVADNHQFLHEAYISDDLVKAIHRFMKLHPKGIPLTDFTAKFKGLMKHELPVEEFGFNSVAEMLQRVRGIDVSKPPESKKLMVFCTTPVCDSETESSDSDRMSAKEKDAKLTDVSSQNKPRSIYAQQPWPSKNDVQCKVYVTYVKTPSRFSVQLIGDTTTKALEALQEDMTAFFNSRDGDGYSIREPYVGQACCAIFNNDGYWYRSEIVSIPTFDIVEVHYVDYGNCSQVPLTSIRRPKAHYLTLPAQGLNCRLANLKPAGSTWNRMATQLFVNMTKDKPIVAFITAIQDNCMSVCLCDTNKKEVDIHINDCLRNQGLAIFDPDSVEDEKDYDGFQLESSTLMSWDEKDVRSPGDIGTIASASLNTATQQKQPVQPQASSISSTNSQPPPPPSTSTPRSMSTSSQASSTLINPTPPLQSTSSLSTITPLTSSVAPSAPPPSSVSFPSLLPNATVPTNNLPLDPSSSFLGGALPSFQSTNPHIAQLQMQNYLQQLLLFQQNALLSGGGLSMFGLQGIANPLLSGSQTSTGQTGLGTGQTNFPPGFAPPGLTQNPPPVASPVDAGVPITGQASQSGLTTQASDSSISGQAGQTGLTTQQVLTNGDGPGVSGQASETGLSSTTEIESTTPTDQTPPTSMASSTHAQADPSSTHPVISSAQPLEDATLPSVTSEAAVVTKSGSARRCESSSVSSLSRSEDSSSISSEGETRQSSRKTTRTAAHRADSCMADSESEGHHHVKKSNVVIGECQLFYNGGARTPAWAKEKAFIKRVRLTHEYCLSILRHDDKAYFLSSEVSEWFWESDLLQSMLRQVQKPCWGLIMMEKKNKKLFQTLRRVQFTSRFVLSRQQITVYALNDLPQIVNTFHGPIDLCTAVRDQVEAWQLLGLSYFTLVSTDEIQLLENTLTELKEKKKHFVQLMMEDDDEGAVEEGGGVDSALSQLIEVKKKISDINRRLCKLKKLASVSKIARSSSTPEPTNFNSKQQSSSEPSVSSKPQKSSGPIIEGASSSSNRVGEVRDHAAGHVPDKSKVDFPATDVKGHTTAPPDVVKSDGILNTVDGEAKKEAAAPMNGEDPIQSTVYPEAPLLQENGLDVDRSSKPENVALKNNDDMAEMDPMFEDVPEAEEVINEDSVFISEDEQPPDDVTQTAAPGTAMTKGDAPIIPASSKSYSSVASSPPSKSSYRIPIHQQQNQQQYPPQRFRANSLPLQQPPTTSASGGGGGHVDHMQSSAYQQRHHYQQPPSPGFFPTRSHSEFIPIPSARASHEQEWPTLHASQQQPRYVHSGVSSNQNVLPPQWPTVGSASPPKSSVNVTSTTPPTPTAVSLLGSPPLRGNFVNSNPLLPSRTVAQAGLLPKPLITQPLTATSPFIPAQGVAAGGVGQQAAKRRPAGIGRGGRPLPPLDNSLLGRIGGGGSVAGGIGRGVPPVRPILQPGQPIPPLYMVQHHRAVALPGGLLPPPICHPVIPPPVTTPIPVSPEERWIYMSRRGRQRSKYGYGKMEDYPPLGSSAGLDII